MISPLNTLAIDRPIPSPGQFLIPIHSSGQKSEPDEGSMVAEANKMTSSAIHSKCKKKNLPNDFLPFIITLLISIDQP